MYPSIDLQDAIRILANNFPKIFHSKQGFWTRILTAIMYNNYIGMGEKVYRQLKRTATGTAVALTFPTLYLRCKFQPTFVKYRTNIVMQRRYIDDGFGITRNRESPEAVLHELNECSNLNIIHQVSQHKAIYLDVEVYKGNRMKNQGIADVKIYTKPISKFLYLHAKSNHPRHVFAGIVKGEAIGFLRNTRDEKTWLQKMQKLLEMFRQRGYKANYLKETLKTIKFKDRQKYLQGQEKLKKTYPVL